MEIEEFTVSWQHDDRKVRVTRELQYIAVMARVTGFVNVKKKFFLKRYIDSFINKHILEKNKRFSVTVVIPL